MVAVMAVTGLVLSGASALAQGSTAANMAQPAVSAPVPQLASGVPQILQLAQAKVSDDTIIAYIKNSGNRYGLNADQIIYLRQQGISDAVLTAMLNQPRPAAAAVMTAMPAPPPLAAATGTESVSPGSSTPVKGAALLRGTPASAEPVSSATVVPTVTYVQTVPASTYYYYQPYYYPAYAWFPPVSFSFGWGGWRGGWCR